MKKFKWKKKIPHAKFGYNLVRMDRVQKHPPWWPSLCGTLHGTCQDCCTCFLEFGAVPKPTNTQSQDMPGMRFFDLQAIITRFALWLPIGFGLLVPISCIQRENSHLRIKSFPRFLLSPQSDKVDSILGMRHIPCHRLSWKLHNPLLNTEIVKKSMAKKTLKPS